MSDAWLQKTATFYGVTMEEATERHRKCVEQGDDPFDPICLGCARRPPEIESYVMATQTGPSSLPPTDEEVREYVISEEGTFNRKNGHFLCDECYIRNGMPSSDRGWVCP